jgi:hypothetical protein
VTINGERVIGVEKLTATVEFLDLLSVSHLRARNELRPGVAGASDAEVTILIANPFATDEQS